MLFWILSYFYPLLEFASCGIFDALKWQILERETTNTYPFKMSIIAEHCIEYFIKPIVLIDDHFNRICVTILILESA